jgi:formate hydrogenlyase subunit 6/NADH:ubiquinone oxidoreductase subunit I
MDFPFIKEAISQLFSKPSCDMYVPDKTKEGAPNYRGRIVFHPDKCINCMMCERVCSGNAISHTVEKTDEGDKVTRTFYLGSCTFCATCMDFCGHGAIEFTRDYHMIATKEEDLMVSGTFIKKPPVRKAPPAKPAAPAAPAKEPAAVTCETIAAEESKAAAPAAMIAPRDDGKPVQVPARCVYCTLCAKKCPAGALTVDRAAKTWTLDEDLCVGCGTCAEACPKKAILMPGDEPVTVAAPAAAPAPAPKAEEKAAPAAEIKPRDDGKPVQDPAKCVYCTICARKCPAGALTVDRAAKTWALDEDLCVGCGTCAEACPKKAIVI